MLRRESARGGGVEQVSLIADELERTEPAVYGVGYAEFQGAITAFGVPVRVRQRFLTPPDGSRFVLGFFQIENVGETALRARLRACADFSSIDPGHKAGRVPEPVTRPGEARLRGIHPTVGDLFLAGPEPFEGAGISWVGIGLSRELELQPGEFRELVFATGYGGETDLAAARERIDRTSWDAEQKHWREKLAPAGLEAPEEWMRRECLWTSGQMLAFKNYNSYLEEHYISLGGYGWGGFNQRELSENVLCLSGPFPEEAAGCLRWAAKSQFACGDLPPGFSLKAPGEEEPPGQVLSSDTEPWFLLAAMTHGQTAPGRELLEQRVPFRDASHPATLWEHAVRAFRWIREEIGVGRHGLVKSWLGDWNDYLFPMGSDGEGESMMNTGIAARGMDLLARLARDRGEPDLAAEAAGARDALREAAGAVWEAGFYPRGFTDAGHPVGSAADDRCFINAQSWAALGGCGSREQRLAALRHALEVCADPRGLVLVSRPFPSPPPADISSLPIPGGQGENGGVWPQAVAWFLWALAEHGLTEEALEIWRRFSFRESARNFPETPFGLFNGPDCYNSHLAGDLAHWTQVQLWDRRVHTPMNPAVVWHAFAMERILRGRAQV